MRSRFWLLFSLLTLIAAPPADALEASEVPAELKPWTDWVLHGHEERLCTRLYGDAGLWRCRWPSRLGLSLDDTGGRFEQEWQLEVEEWVPLPGDEKRPALDVLVNGRPAAVHPRGGAAGVRLPRGRHQVSGRFVWSALPEVLPVPSETALLYLTVRGERVAFPQREADGRVWLQRRATEETSENRMEILVHRRIVDDVPLLVETRIELRVSGENREELLGTVLLPETVPTRLDSGLPARIENDGRLRVQVRPGTWVVTVEARHTGRVAALPLPENAGPWTESEVWVFEARRHLRIVDVEGVFAVDPQQTRLPDGWRSLPAYRLEPGGTMQLTERRRGDSDPAPDQLRLERQWWVDFDGSGLTVQDRLSGTLNSGWRLTMQDPTELGRVVVDGHDQLITRLSESAPAGVEIRRRQMQVLADSRFEGKLTDVPAVGWNHDFQSVSGTLHLPPGWRLLLASGPDQTSPRDSVWFDSWTLLDIFLVLILAVSFARLWGMGWGAVAAVTLMLVLPDDGPTWVFAFLVAGEGLFRVLPDGWFKKLVWLYRGLVLLILVLISVEFMVMQARVGLYPVLEHEYRTITGEHTGYGWSAGDLFGASADALAGSAKEAAPETWEAEDLPAAPPVEQNIQQQEIDGRGEWKSAPSRRQRVKKKLSRLMSYQVDPSAAVQTGPGLPRWEWNQFQLSWSGPVTRAQTMGLWVLPPWMNTALAFVRILLVALMLACVLGMWGDRLKKFLAAASKVSLGVLLLLPATALAEVPRTEVLDQLRDRLLEAPPCVPTCAAIGRLELTATRTDLALRMEVTAEAPTGLPLPADGQHWVPTDVVLDGSPAEGIAHSGDGRLWLAIPAGKHQVLLKGPLPRRDSVQLPLPVRPARTSANVDGWTLDGLHADGLADASLQLTRVKTAGGAGDDLEAGALPPFVRVERRLNLGLDWEVETSVVRVTPIGAAAVLEVPLLPGESPTTEELRLVDGKVQVNLAPNATELVWTSVLEPSEQIVFVAPERTEWVEVWHLEASPVWHVEPEGIPPIHQQAPEAIRQWRPWPGEKLALTVTRPEAVPGQVLTIDRALLAMSPGKRAADAQLTLEVRASRGERHTVTLPEGAVLQTVHIDGTEQPIRQEERQVVLPVRPGAQSFRLAWREDQSTGVRYRSPVVNLGAPAVNAGVHVSPPAGRWVIFAPGGDFLVGPAVLFWSLFAVILVAAVLLDRVPVTPIRHYQWVLLGVGLSQGSIWVAAIVAGWLLFLGWRRKKTDVHAALFDLRQVLIGAWTVAAFIGLFAAVRQGLLGDPDMQITGNGSTRYLLQWFTDRAGEELPRAGFISVPMFVYRLLMLAWAMWLAWALLKWLKWGWACFREGGLWLPIRVKVADASTATPVTETPIVARPVDPGPGDDGGGERP